MGRLARVIAVGVPHHVTQRGNARRPVFECDADRLTYLQLLDSHCQLYGVSVAGFCLMSNHVHLVVTPRRPDALGLALRHAHGRYATYINARHATCGHVWQRRYYSCPLDAEHLWVASRYTECNPVRARMVEAADQYRWSSAAIHCGTGPEPLPISIDLEAWRAEWSISSWRAFLVQGEADEEGERLRANTHCGRPLGSPEFVKRLEQTLHRTLVPRRAAGPKQNEDPAQAAFIFS